MKALTNESRVLSSIKGEFIYYYIGTYGFCQHFFTKFFKILLNFVTVQTPFKKCAEILETLYRFCQAEMWIKCPVFKNTFKMWITFSCILPVLHH